MTGYNVFVWYPIDGERRKKYGRFLPIQAHEVTITRAGKATKERRSLSETQGWLQIYSEDEAYYGRHMCHCSIGNDLSEIRRALLEHKRGGRPALQKYYSNPTSYTADQYLQARLDAARRCLDRRNVKLAGNSDGKGILALPDPCLLYTSPSPRDRTRSRMPSSA